MPGEFSHHGGIGTVAVEDLPEEINKDEVNIQEKELGDLKQILYETEKNLILESHALLWKHTQSGPGTRSEPAHDCSQAAPILQGR